MKKRLFVSAIITFAFALSLCACSGGYEAISINYGTGENSRGQVNDTFYYRNDCYVSGADPFVLYVDEKDDPVNGGYYYMYCSVGESYSPDALPDVQCMGIGVYRSEDLKEWERAGDYDGYAVISKSGEWTKSDFWAPEVLAYKNEAGEPVYYMYYSASTSSVRGSNDDMYLAVAQSLSPAGPFELIVSGTDKDGNAIGNASIFDVAKQYDAAGFSVIDAGIFQDGDALYLTFAKQSDTRSPAYGRGTWGVKLKDPVTPDWSTFTCLTLPSYYETEEYPAGTLSVPVGKNKMEIEEVLNEGQFIYRHNGRYYLTYSPYGFGNKGYCVMQAVSDSALGPYKKIEIGKGNPVIDTVYSEIDSIAGPGHHCIVDIGGEPFSFYAKHANPSNFTDASLRLIGMDRLSFTTIEGQEVLVGNGPTESLQYAPEILTGYRNLAKDATVTVKSGSGEEYLNDGLLTIQSSLQNREFETNSATTITLTFSEAVEVSSVMVYNSEDYYKAFSKIDRIAFWFEDKTEINGKRYDCAVIEELAFPSSQYDLTKKTIEKGSAAVADFLPVKVNKITFTVSAKISDTDRRGNAYSTIGISEIVVLGK